MPRTFYNVLSLLASCIVLRLNPVLAEENALFGKVVAQGLASTVVNLYTADGTKRQTFVDSEGNFVFENVPVGGHLLQAYNVNQYFPEITVDMGKSGPFRVTLIAQAPSGTVVQPYSIPIILRPLGELQYFEKRKPVDVMSFVKSPYGLMIVFSLFIIVVLPKLKVDPEEMAELQAQMRGGSGGAAAATGAGQQRIASR